MARWKINFRRLHAIETAAVEIVATDMRDAVYEAMKRIGREGLVGTVGPPPSSQQWAAFGPPERIGDD